MEVAGRRHHVRSVLDKYNQSIGAIAIDRTNPKTVWVGTGESWTRNSVSVGDGLYKTTDGGDNWTKVGLEDCERIAKIAIDPEHPDTVFVAVPGHLWNSHPSRGVFRTRDGGKTWQKVLYVNEDTGCGDLAIDPSNPSIVYAGMWQFRRKPWSFASGGPGSGLYKSTDGGTTWKKITQGMPAGDLGRIGIAIAPSKPNVIYAAVEAKRGGIYRSDDRGDTWTEMNTGASAAVRPFYFGIILVDPKDENRIYKPGINLVSSDDAGKSLANISGGVHSDFHAVDRPAGFRAPPGGHRRRPLRVERPRQRLALRRQPADLAVLSRELRHGAAVQRMAACKDNGSGRPESVGASPIATGACWAAATACGAFVDPNDSDITYVEYQEGNMLRVRKSTGESKEIKPFRTTGEPDYRFNWNTPIHMSPSKAGTMYVGAQFPLPRAIVARSGSASRRISPPTIRRG